MSCQFGVNHQRTRLHYKLADGPWSQVSVTPLQLGLREVEYRLQQLEISSLNLFLIPAVHKQPYLFILQKKV